MENDTNALPTRAEEMICFAIYSAGHAFNRAYGPMLKALKLTYPQYLALMTLWEGDGKTVSQLSDKLKLEPSTLTPLLKRLEGQGHIRRTRGSTDQRQVFLHLTESGRALEARSAEMTRCIIGSTGMTLDELEQLVATISRLRDAVASA